MVPSIRSVSSWLPASRKRLALVVVGFSFKIASVPFHQWTPDVYEGAPTSVTAFMAVGTKGVAFLVLLRLLTVSFGDALVEHWDEFTEFLNPWQQPQARRRDDDV